LPSATARGKTPDMFTLSPAAATRRFPVVGHAIVSADGMIADAEGLMPRQLRNDADWALFQAALDAASVVVVGSLGHRRHPNPGRRRLVFTSTVREFVTDGRDHLATLFNPESMAVADVLDAAGLADGVVAVTGGRRVFDHFLRQYDEFMLAEVNGFVMPGGIACFSNGHPRAVLAAAGMVPVEHRVIDAENGVTLTRWIAVEAG
jgi:dihydrofolate reductase